MKFLQVYCHNRQALVYINTEKIVLLYKDVSGAETDNCFIEVEGLSDNKGPVKVNSTPEDLIKMINGEDKTRIGFRTGS